MRILMDFLLMYSPVRNLTKPTSIPALQRTSVLSIGGWGRLVIQIGVVGKLVVSMGRVSILAIPSGIRFPSWISNPIVSKIRIMCQRFLVSLMM